MVSSFGALVEQPLELRGDGTGLGLGYSQIQFSFGRRTDFVVFETDLCMKAENGQPHSGLTFIFDTPEVRNVTFTRGGFIETFVSGLLSRAIGSFAFNQRIHFRAELNLARRRWRLLVDGVLLEDSNFNADGLESVRINLQDAVMQNPAAAIDNVRLISYEGTPTIIQPPRAQAVTEGDIVTLEVVSSGDRPLGQSGGLRYQWLFNGLPISGANAQTLSIPGVLLSEAGSYSVEASNSFGSTTSATAVLAVEAGPAHLQNISTRLAVETGDNVLIGGFIVQGTGAKKVILRAIGPSLNVNGAPVPGRLADPVLQLYNSAGALIATNDNWRDTQEQEIIASTVPPTHDKESALIASLPAGSYTAVVRGANASSGVALVEAYELDPRTAVKVVNVSTRGFVKSAEGVMIGGFILGGAKPATVLVRGIGPSLSQSGIPARSTLQDPVLEIRNASGELIAENDNWRSAQEAEIAATGAPPTDDREAAIVTTLNPGNYTALVRSAGGGTGLGLVEVYHLGR